MAFWYLLLTFATMHFWRHAAREAAGVAAVVVWVLLIALVVSHTYMHVLPVVERWTMGVNGYCQINGGRTALVVERGDDVSPMESWAVRPILGLSGGEDGACVSSAVDGGVEYYTQFNKSDTVSAVADGVLVDSGWEPGWTWLHRFPLYHVMELFIAAILVVLAILVWMKARRVADSVLSRDSPLIIGPIWCQIRQKAMKIWPGRIR